MRSWLAKLLGYPELFRRQQILLRVNTTLLEQNRFLMFMIPAAKIDDAGLAELAFRLGQDYVELKRLQEQMNSQA